MLRLAICDDNEYVVEQIESYIERIKEVAIKYEVYFSAEEFIKICMRWILMYIF